MKRVLLSAAVLSVVGLHAQVGIEENDPKATLDVGGDLRVQSVPEVKTNKEEYSKCPCLLLIGNDGKLKRYGDTEALKALGINPETSSGSTPDSGDGGGGGKGKDDKDPETTQPQPSTPTVVGGTATFATLSSIEKNIVSFKYGNKPNDKIQGQVTSTGVPVKIPYTGATAGSVEEKIIAVEGKPNLKLKIKGAYISAGDGALDAEIYYDGTENYNLPLVTLQQVEAGNYKQTDVTFKVKVNGVTNPVTVKVNALGGIRDKLYDKLTNGKLEHQFLYLPVVGPDGRTWLNNNLGAYYARVNDPVDGNFNPARQATSRGDHNAYGSLFQWGRVADGYELMTWTGSSSGHGTYQNIYWDNLWPDPVPDWDPCPDGYRLPTEKDLTTLISHVGDSNPNAPTFWLSSLKLSYPGTRESAKDTDFEIGGKYGTYWSLDYVGYAGPPMLRLDRSLHEISYGWNGNIARSIRCLKK